MPVVLYGFETWSLTLREECRLRIIENRVLRRIFGAERDEVTGEWIPHNINIRAVGLRGGGIDWIDLAQDRVRWRAVLDVLIILRDP